MRVINTTSSTIDASRYAQGATAPATPSWANVAPYSVSTYQTAAPGQFMFNVKRAGTALFADALALPGAAPRSSAGAGGKIDIEALPGTTVAGSAITAIVFPAFRRRQQGAPDGDVPGTGTLVRVGSSSASRQRASETHRSPTTASSRAGRRSRAGPPSACSAALLAAMLLADESGHHGLTRRRPHSILSPVVDFLCVGGLSLILFCPLLLSGRTDLVLIGAGAQAWIATVDQHAALHGVVPARLPQPRVDPAAQVGVDLRPARSCSSYIGARRSGRRSTRRSLVIIFISVSSAYLAWHYTGQVWGMMASYAYLDGARFDKSERFLIRTGLRILLAWHVTWFLYTQLRESGESLGPRIC